MTAEQRLREALAELLDDIAIGHERHSVKQARAALALRPDCGGEMSTEQALREALTDAMGHLSMVGPSCQLGLVPRCKCDRCIRIRARAALALPASEARVEYRAEKAEVELAALRAHVDELLAAQSSGECAAILDRLAEVRKGQK